VSAQTNVRIGSEFLGYRIEELIGRGGMGVVHRAYDRQLKRAVAVKFISPDLALDDRFRERFLQESELAASLEHPNAVPIHDAGEIDGRLYLAMRYVEGTDLRTLLRDEGRLSPARAIAICAQVAGAVDAAHEKGLVHRDIKPSNVLLDRNEHVYLADFGLTRRLAEPGVRAVDRPSLGTPAYLAPEQVEEAAVDGRADVYSLGCLLYECLTGEPPFPRDSALAVVWAHLEEEPPRSSRLNPELPEAIDDVFAKAMAKEPNARYPMCAALITAAEDALGLRRPPFLHRRRLLLGTAASLLAVLAAVLSTALVTHGDSGVSQAPLFGEGNTLVRIDPVTNEVSDVIEVDERPSAVAAFGSSVWVYNHGNATVTEVDALTREPYPAARLSAPPDYLGDAVGPILAADSAGAWVIGTDAQGNHALTRILSRARGSHAYRLGYEPRAVAVGAGAVWVLGWGRRDAVLRINPVSGKVVGTTVLPTSARVTGLAVGAGAVWVVDPSSAALYRVDVHSGKVVSRSLPPYATRPYVAFGSVWVGTSAVIPVLVGGILTSGGGTMYLVDPRTLRETHFGTVGRPDQVVNTSGYGSTLAVNVETGTVVRFDPETKLPTATIRITRIPPAFYGPPVTAIAAGAGAIWVTVAAD
jgi:tRNA A-37 threonylcarbamoyl transferase component Bud32